ncbi:leucine-rich repeat protein [Lysinibacillus louembei]|uniref:Leucine-rich repeat protein n=1 Tax=Lysinibacillus louembei TaxID=1470088 RepID=A0ABZ0S347_9BACI|nr:leucine-rich repeat protein [Lysinibacillus louembei]WPK13746.1 leucine-rich repeat protein [Lysinibacillus louembei]
MKKIGLLVLMLLLILFQLPASPAKADNSLFEFDNGTITGYNGVPPTKLLIPDSINGIAVTGIAERAFADKYLTFVHIPFTVEYIGDEAFAGNNLRMVRFDWVEAIIGEGAFDNQEIEGGFGGWFTNPELTNQWNGQAGDFTIYSAMPATYTVSFDANGGSSFSPRALIENSFLEIWERPEKPGLAFEGWYKDQGLTDKLNFLDMITGDMTLYAKWINPFMTVKNSDNALTITGYQGNPPENLVIPEEIDGFNVTRIGNEAFKNANLQSVTLPSTLTWVSEQAFRGNQLSNIVIPDTVSYIGQFAFSDNHLQSVTLPSELDSIAEYVFNNNQLTNMVIPDNITYIGSAAFAGNELTSLTISNSVQFIGSYAFQNNQLTSLIIPDNVREIGMFAFENNNLTSLQLSSGLSKLDFSSFSRNNLTDVTVPNSVTYIDEFAFYDNKLSNVILPDSVTYIGALAFGENQLTGIIIPNSVETIGVGAFKDNKLTNIVIPEKVTVIEDSAFEKNKLASVTMPEGITEIKDLAFSRNELASLEIPSTVTHIGNEAFKRNKLTNLTLPNSIISIGEWAFSDNQLTAVHIPDGITKIEDYTFFNNKLTEVMLPESVTHIGEFAFDSSNLTSLIIPRNVTYIGQGAFMSNKLAKVVFDGAVNTVEFVAFEDQRLSNPKFKGWFTDYALTQQWDETVPQSMTIYSVAPITYTVQFETNGGSPLAAKIIIEGEKLLEIETPTKENFIFAGWYRDSTFQTAWNFATDKITENTTLYAKWTAVPTTNPPVVTSPSGSNSTPSTATEIRVDVVDASNPDAVLVQTVITRETSNGIVKDTVNFTAANAREAIEKLMNQQNKKSRIIIPDEQQQVSETTIGIAKEAAQILVQNQTSMGIDMETVKFDIPATSFANINSDIYFRVVPVKAQATKQQLEQRAKTEEIVKQLTSTTVTLLGQPMTIETNMQNRPVTLTLPLPNDVTQEQLDSLAVYIEHSDGTKEVVRGQIVDFKTGIKGIQFDVTKFSTFTILYAPVEKEETVVENPVSIPYIQGYADGTFRPNASVTRAQMASMLARHLTNNEIPTASPSFKDTAKHGAKDAIEYVKAQGLFQGTTATTFQPNGTITRAQMAAVVVRWMEQQGAELTFDTKSTFTDVKANHWAAEAIAKVHALGIMTGTSQTTFNPEGALTRAQAVKVLNQLFELEVQASERAPLFKDVTSAHWAFDDIQAAAQ